MATSMDDALSCPVCYDHLDNPKILACGHSFCKKCLDDVYRSKSYRELPCPMCRQVTPIPQRRVSMLPTNITVKGLVDSLKTAAARGDTPKTLARGDTHNTATPDGDMQKKVEQKMTALTNHVEHVKRQKQEVKAAISARKGEIRAAFGEDVATLGRRKNALLKECENHESVLLAKLDKLTDRDNKLVESIINAQGSRGNGEKSFVKGHQVMTDNDPSRDSLEGLLNMDDPDLSEATAITRHGERLNFVRKRVDLDLGEVKIGDIVWKEKVCVKIDRYKHFDAIPRIHTQHGRMPLSLSQTRGIKTDAINAMASTRDGRMAAGMHAGGIQIYSASGELLQTVLDKVGIRCLAFLSHGRSCIVIDFEWALSMYTPCWKKLDVRFATLDKPGRLCVDRQDNIYVSYREAKRIQVFAPSGGKPFREISCGDHIPQKMDLLESSKTLVVTSNLEGIITIDEQGSTRYKLSKDSNMVGFSHMCIGDDIIVACINSRRDRVSIEQYTSELTYTRTLVKDHEIVKGSWWCYLQQFKSGELALCTGDRFHIFYQ